MTMLNLTINGRRHGPVEVRDDLSMNDFLREMLGMTGTKFGCGVAQCLSCAIIVDNPDGTSYTSPTCVVSAASFDGKAIRTVEGHAKDGELSALQKAFIDRFAFQCGYCTPGFLTRFRNIGRISLSCPTCQVALSNAGSRRLLCMGLFSIFWQRACGGRVPPPSPAVMPAREL